MRTALLITALLLAGPACRREATPATKPPPAAEPAPSAPAAAQEPAGGAGSDVGGDQRIGPEHLRYWIM